MKKVQIDYKICLTYFDENFELKKVKSCWNFKSGFFSRILKN